MKVVWAALASFCQWRARHSQQSAAVWIARSKEFEARS